MPVHDWTRVDAGIFDDFHNVWIAELRNALNCGVLPEGYYAMSEQHANRRIADVLTLHAGDTFVTSPASSPGHAAVAEAPPKVGRMLALSASARARRKTLAVRHVSGDRLVAVIEVISRGNKDRPQHVELFLNKVEDAISNGIHVLVVDLFPPGPHDPCGMHGAIWDRLGDTPEEVPAEKPLTLASYAADALPNVCVEYLAVGDVLPEMPLFLSPDFYVNTPLETTYQAAWRGTPERWRKVIQPGT